MNGVYFFASAISTFESKGKGSKSNANDEQDLMSSDDEDGVMSSQSFQHSIETNQHAKEASDKKRHPAITYWIAVQSPNGAPVSPTVVQSALLNCSVEAHPTRAACKTKQSSEILNKLCQTIKDHKNNYMADLVNESYVNCFSRLSEQLIGRSTSTIAFNERLVRFTIVKPTSILTQAIKRLRDKGLQMDVYDSPTTDKENKVSMQVKPLGDELTVLCNDVERAMLKLRFAIHKGDVYKLRQDAIYTYHKLCPVDEFLHSLLGNDYFKQRLLRNMPKLLSILKHPGSQAIRQIQIDNDIVEVNNNWFWSFSKNTFKKGVLDGYQPGEISPRAFVPFDHDSDVDPGFFKEILENSLDEEQTVQFCKDFLNLFKLNSRQHKDKVPCLIGPSNSGKTSILLATSKIIDQTKVARVLKQKEFNKSMINEETQLINLDEAVVNLMDVDDWKVLLQGGLTAHDVKYRSAKSFVNSAPIFITSQKDLDFGSKVDNEAMENRLTKYFFKPLPEVVPEAALWLKEHPMHCIVWAANVVKQHKHKLVVNEETSKEERPGLSTQDRVEIFNLKMSSEESLSIAPNEEDMESDDSQTEFNEEGTEESENEPDTQFLTCRDSLQAAKSQCLAECNFGKAKMVERLMLVLEEEKEKRKQQERKTNKSIRERQKKWLVDLGVDKDLVSQHLPKQPDISGKLPSQLQRTASECTRQRKKEQEKKDREKTKQNFSSTWLQSQEKKMRALQEELEKCTDEKVKMAKQYILTTASDAIKLYHQQNGTSPDLGLKLRQQLCYVWGLVSRRGRKRIDDLYSPLPVESTEINTSPKRKRKSESCSQVEPSKQPKITKFFSQS